MNNQPFIIEAPGADRRPLFRGSLVFGGIFVLVGALCLFLFAQGAQLSCTQAADGEARCTIARSFLGLVPLQSQTVERVHGAQVGRSCKKANCTYRVELVLEGGKIQPLTEAYTAVESEKIALAERINQAFKAGEFKITQPPSLLAVLVPLAFIAAGIYAMLVPMRPGRHFPH